MPQTCNPFILWGNLIFYFLLNKKLKCFLSKRHIDLFTCKTRFYIFQFQQISFSSANKNGSSSKKLTSLFVN